MKYLKRFEKYIEYKVGDYILLDIARLGFEEDSKYAIITVNDTGTTYPYRIEFTDGNFFRLRDDEIERLMTPDEIKEFELKKAAETYNL